jgi:hypothetical protein
MTNDESKMEWVVLAAAVLFLLERWKEQTIAPK